jgi:hypothetical protein
VQRPRGNVGEGFRGEELGWGGGGAWKVLHLSIGK